MIKQDFYIHGDVLIKRIKNLPKEGELKKLGVNFLAEGEVTGHAHRLHPKELNDYSLFEPIKPNGKKYLKLLRSVPLRHEEHNEILLPPGEYEIGITKEYDYETDELRSVAD